MSKIILEESMLAIWYVAFVEHADFMLALRRTDTDRFKVCYAVRAYDHDGRRELQQNMTPEGLSERRAIAGTRRFIEEVVGSAPAPIKGRWEVVRGGRTLEEFKEALSTMPLVVPRCNKDEAWKL